MREKVAFHYFRGEEAHANGHGIPDRECDLDTLQGINRGSINTVCGQGASSILAIEKPPQTARARRSIGALRWHVDALKSASNAL
jgi:hypothetical protein